MWMGMADRGVRLLSGVTEENAAGGIAIRRFT